MLQISISKIYSLSTEPTNKVLDRFWFNTTNKQLYHCDGTNWVPVNVSADDVVINSDGTSTSLVEYLELEYQPKNLAKPVVQETTVEGALNKLELLSQVADVEINKLEGEVAGAYELIHQNIKDTNELKETTQSKLSYYSEDTNANTSTLSAKYTQIGRATSDGDPIVSRCLGFRMASNFQDNGDDTYSVAVSNLTTEQEITYATLSATSYATAHNASSTILSGYAVGDILSINNSSEYYDVFTITAISGNGITFTSNKPAANVLKKDTPSFNEYVIYCLAKPNVGYVDVTSISLATGIGTQALGLASTATGAATQAFGNYGFATGTNTKAGYAAFSSGKNTKALGEQSFASGSNTIASANNSFASGHNTKANGGSSHAEGTGTETSGDSAHAEGEYSKATANYAHAEGSSTVASGVCSHAEGQNSQASAMNAHAEGYNCKAQNYCSHAEGIETIANANGQHVGGGYNVADNSKAFIIGNGSSDSNRNNALTVDWNGDLAIDGNLIIGDTSGNPTGVISAVDTSVSDKTDNQSVPSTKAVNTALDKKANLDGGNEFTGQQMIYSPIGQSSIIFYENGGIKPNMILGSDSGKTTIDEEHIKVERYGGSYTEVDGGTATFASEEGQIQIKPATIRYEKDIITGQKTVEGAIKSLDSNKQNNLEFYEERNGQVYISGDFLNINSNGVVINSSDPIEISGTIEAKSDLNVGGYFHLSYGSYVNGIDDVTISDQSDRIPNSYLVDKALQGKQNKLEYYSETNDSISQCFLTADNIGLASGGSNKPYGGYIGVNYGSIIIDGDIADYSTAVDVNTLSNSSTKLPSSKAVKNYVDNSIAALPSVYTPQGSVTNFADLPTNPQVGWVYDIENAFTLNGKPYPAGTNVVWTASGKWDALGGIVDLSAYQTKELSTAINGLTATTVEGSLSEIVGDYVSLNNDTKESFSNLETQISNLETNKANSSDVYTKAQTDTEITNAITIDTFNTLNTTSKTVAGAVNELKAEVVDLTDNKVDKTTKINGFALTGDIKLLAKDIKYQDNDDLTVYSVLHETAETANSLRSNALNKNFDLSDVSNVAKARTNLDVYSKGEVDTTVSGINSSISTIQGNISTINTSLSIKANTTDVYSKSDIDEKITILEQADEDLTNSVTSINTTLNNKANSSDVVLNSEIDTTLPTSPVDTHVPSTKLLETILATKQDKANVQVVQGVFTSTSANTFTQLITDTTLANIPGRILINPNINNTGAVYIGVNGSSTTTSTAMPFYPDQIQYVEFVSINDIYVATEVSGNIFNYVISTGFESAGQVSQETLNLSKQLYNSENE